MGVSISKDLDLSKNEYLQRFVSEDRISLQDPFWNRFLTFNVKPADNSEEQLAFESRIESSCQALLKNGLVSGNFGALVDVFLIRSAELLAASDLDANLFSWQLYNNLFIIKTVIKSFTETLNEQQLLQHLDAQKEISRLEPFIEGIVNILVDIPVNNTTYYVHLEAISTLIVLLSVPIQNNLRPDESNVFRILMSGRHATQAPLLVKNLLNNFISQEKKPPGFGLETGNSIVLGLASGLWSMLTFGKGTAESKDTLGDNDETIAPISSESLLLVLILSHHWTTKGNPYRDSLFMCLNSEDANPVPATNALTVFKINYNSLYNSLCKKVTGDSATLLLYLMLHRNSNFKKYVLRRLDLEELVIPILKSLYNAPNSNSHHIYMSLIILLIMSEDDIFNKTIHSTKLKNILWYTERTLTEVSLGGLLILVVIRTVQYNMLKMRDKYLHTNCLAALANMSSEFRDLHPYVSQRLVSLFETLAKKYQKLMQSAVDTNKMANHHEVIQVSQETPIEIEQDLNVLEEVLRMVLEILNSCLTHQLTRNPNLVYTLMYNKDIFQTFKNYVVFQDIIYNIDIVIQYFSKLLEEKQQLHEVDASHVLLVIQQGSKDWPKEKLTKFPELKFKYVEEDQPEEFFIPYVWALVNEHSVVHFKTETSLLITTV